VWRTVGSWAVFGLAVVSFSRLWQGVRAALDGHRMYGPLEAIGWMGLFVATMGSLALMIYAADRASGRAKRRIRLFDRLLDGRSATAGGAREP
jgi:hypothetical protein